VNYIVTLVKTSTLVDVTDAQEVEQSVLAVPARYNQIPEKKILHCSKTQSDQMHPDQRSTHS